MTDKNWREQQRMAAAERAAVLARRQAAETEQARQLLAEFTADARTRDLRTERLKATSHNGRWRYRTHIEGWYLRRNRSLGVGVDGSFYILTVPPSMASLLKGADLEPEDPPLEVGKGGRDGESMPLAELLKQRLDSGDDWG